MSNVVSLDRTYCNICQTLKPSSDFSSQARAQALAGDENAACLPCVNHLYDSRLARDEVEPYLKQDMAVRNKPYELSGQEERKDSPARWGHVLHSSELLLRLQRIIPNLHVKDGRIGNDVSLFQVIGDEIKYLVWTHQGNLPEYSIVVTNWQNRPVREIRGWRTVLLRLIKAGVITEEQAVKQFGSPTNGEAARFYLQELAWHRNQRNLGKDGN
jgi:hypothetical protein